MTSHPNNPTLTLTLILTHHPHQGVDYRDLYEASDASVEKPFAKCSATMDEIEDPDPDVHSREFFSWPKKTLGSFLKAHLLEVSVTRGWGVRVLWRWVWV